MRDGPALWKRADKVEPRTAERAAGWCDLRAKLAVLPFCRRQLEKVVVLPRTQIAACPADLQVWITPAPQSFAKYSFWTASETRALVVLRVAS